MPHTTLFMRLITGDIILDYICSRHAQKKKGDSKRLKENEEALKNIILFVILNSEIGLRL